MKITYCLLLYLHRFIWNTLDDSTSCLRSHITVHLQFFVYAFQACTSSLLAFFQCTCRLFIRIKFLKEPCVWHCISSAKFDNLSYVVTNHRESYYFVLISIWLKNSLFFLNVFIVKITVTWNRNWKFVSFKFFKVYFVQARLLCSFNLLLNFLFV